MWYSLSVDSKASLESAFSWDIHLLIHVASMILYMAPKIFVTETFHMIYRPANLPGLPSSPSVCLSNTSSSSVQNRTQVLIYLLNRWLKKYQIYPIEGNDSQIPIMKLHSYKLIDNLVLLIIFLTGNSSI